MKKFAKEQPMDGETILHCGHLEGNLHWWKFPHEVYFKRPDGTVGTCAWMAACNSCFEKSNNDPMKIDIVGDSTWTGDDPAIYETRNDNP